jgi:molybdopterin-guanine dinucleotide biosynthesis protein A
VESLRDAGEDVDIRDHAPPLAGVVLCGGRSLRMGTDKASIEFEGVTLLDRALTRLREVCDPVLVAPGDVAVGAAAYAAVVDAIPGAGPLAGLVAALRASPHRLLAVVAVDLPWIDPALLRMLAARVGDYDVALCETARGVEPLHAVYSRSALAGAERALDGSDRSLHALIERVRAVRVTEDEWRAAGISQRFSRNLNTPADLAELSLESGPAVS